VSRDRVTTGSHTRKRGSGLESGATLVEVLIAITIIAIGVTGIVVAMMSSIRASGTHRRQVTADTVVKAYSEAITQQVSQPGGYVTCAVNPTAYQSPAAFATVPGFAATVAKIRVWDSASSTFIASGLPASCAGATPTDAGLQELDVVASATARPSQQSFSDTDQLQLVIRRP